jgi:hypothetical protein
MITVAKIKIIFRIVMIMVAKVKFIFRWIKFIMFG